MVDEMVRATTIKRPQVAMAIGSCDSDGDSL